MVDPGHSPEVPTRPMVARRRSTVRMASRGESDSADGVEVLPFACDRRKTGVMPTSFLDFFERLVGFLG